MSDTETRYVCMPCRELSPDISGEIVVPGPKERHGAVWCPWCGDKMERYVEGTHG